MITDRKSLFSGAALRLGSGRAAEVGVVGGRREKGTMVVRIY